MAEFKSFYKTVGGNEGNKCNYPTRLDTYGCGCMHDCKYCYAKSLLDFRGLWNPTEPSVADIEKIKKKIKKIAGTKTPVRLGGMTDCFQPIEKKKNEIEAKLGVSLNWCRAEQNKTSWISYELTSVSIANEADWPHMIRFHSEWSDKMCNAMLPYLKGLYPDVNLD